MCLMTALQYYGNWLKPGNYRWNIHLISTVQQFRDLRLARRLFSHANTTERQKRSEFIKFSLSPNVHTWFEYISSHIAICCVRTSFGRHSEIKSGNECQEYARKYAQCTLQRIYTKWVFWAEILETHLPFARLPTNLHMNFKSKWNENAL